jgi:5-methyltetrahydrofolate corrinoid/iron sulfur protein methyltransferase
MLMSHGLEAAIVDVEDQDLVAAMKTAEILLNQKLYADDYLKG